MGLLSWMSGANHRADDEHCADIVRQYLTTHDINPEQWTEVKGESAVRIYAGDGTRAGRKVGFYVKLDEADMTPKGVVIPEKYGLATYAHHWRKLWAMDRRWPLYEFILRQMPGAYEDIEASRAREQAAKQAADEAAAQAREVAERVRVAKIAKLWDTIGEDERTLAFVEEERAEMAAGRTPYDADFFDEEGACGAAGRARSARRELAIELGVAVETIGTWKDHQAKLELYQREAAALIQDDPRWRQYFAQTPAAVFKALGQDIEDDLAGCFNKGVSARQCADSYVHFFTDGPMPFAVQAALHKVAKASIAETEDALRSWQASLKDAEAGRLKCDPSSPAAFLNDPVVIREEIKRIEARLVEERADLAALAARCAA
jgi:hypothetical protein